MRSQPCCPHPPVRVLERVVAGTTLRGRKPSSESSSTRSPAATPGLDMATPQTAVRGEIIGAGADLFGGVEHAGRAGVETPDGEVIALRRPGPAVCARPPTTHEGLGWDHLITRSQPGARARERRPFPGGGPAGRLQDHRRFGDTNRCRHQATCYQATQANRQSTPAPLTVSTLPDRHRELSLARYEN